MAYPFGGKGLPFHRVRERLAKLGCTFEPYIGNTIIIRRDGKVYVIDIFDTDVAGPTQIRSICDRLGISHEEFGEPLV